jgi:hypothetical protein
VKYSTINYRLIAYFLGTVIAVRLLVLFLVGPAIWPDTAAYVAFADAILAHGKRSTPWIGKAVRPHPFSSFVSPVIRSSSPSPS